MLNPKNVEEKSPSESALLLTSTRKSYFNKSKFKDKVTPIDKFLKIKSMKEYENPKSFSEKRFLVSHSENIFSVYDHENVTNLTPCGLFPIEIKFFQSLFIIVISFSNGEICLYNTQNEIKLLKKIKENTHYIQNFIINDQGTRLLTASEKKLKIFDIYQIEDDALLVSIDHKFNDVTALDFNPIFPEIIFFSGHNLNYIPIFIWNFAKNQIIKEINNILGRILYGFFGPNGNNIYTISDDKSFRCWSLQENSFDLIGLNILKEFESSIVKCVIDDKREKIFLATKHDNLFIYDIKTPERENIIFSSSFDSTMELLGFYCQLNLSIHRIGLTYLLKSIETGDRNLTSFTINESKDKTKISFIQVFFDGKTLMLIDSQLNLYELKNSEQKPTKIYNFYFSQKSFDEKEENKIEKEENKPEKEENKPEKEEKILQKENSTENIALPMPILASLSSKLEYNLPLKPQNSSKSQSHSILSLGPIHNIFINTKESLLLAVGNDLMGIFDLVGNSLIKSSSIKEIMKMKPTSEMLTVRARFFLNDSFLLLTSAKKIAIINLEDLSLKKEMMLYFQSFSSPYCDSDSETVYFVVENRAYAWKVDFTNNSQTETLKAATILFRFDYEIKEISYIPKKQLCCILFARYEMNKVFVYDMNTKQLIKLLAGHEKNLITFRPIRKNIEVFYSFCSDFCIFWNIQTGCEIKKIKMPSSVMEKARIYEVEQAVSKLYIGLQQGSIYVLDIEKGCEEKIFHSAHFKAITSLILYGDDHLISTSFDEQIKVWNFKYNEEWVFENLNFDESSNLNGHFSPDSNKLGVVNLRSSSIYVVDLLTKIIIFQKETDPILKVFAWSSNSSAFMVNVRNIGYIYHLDPLKPKLILHGHSIMINACVFNSKDNQLCTGGSDSVLIVWDLNLDSNTIKENKKITGHKGRITALAYHPQNDDLLCIATGTFIKIMSLINSTEIIKFNGNSGIVNSINFNSKGNKICSSGTESHIRVWDVSSGEEDYKLTWETTLIPESIFSADDSKIYCCGLDSRLVVWDLRSKTAKYYDRDEGTIYNSVSYNKKYDLICTAAQNVCFKKSKERSDDLIQMQCLKILNNYKENFEELFKQINKKIIYRLATNFIEPYHFSIMHIMLYLEEYEAFGNFIEILKKHQEKFTFFSDFKGKNAIDILLEKKQFGLLDELANYLIEFPPSRNDCHDTFNESLLNIMNHRNHLIDSLLSSRVIEIGFNSTLYTTYFPDVINATFDSREPNFNELQKLYPTITKEKSEDKIILKLIDFPNISHPSSKFLSLLLKNFNADNAIFVNDVVVNVINYKWNSYGFFIYVFNLIRFMVSLVLISINSIYFFVERERKEGNSFTIGSFIIDSLLVIIWLIPNIMRRNYNTTFSKMEMRYKFNFWNIIDAISTIFLISYVIFDWIYAWNKDYESSDVKIIHSLTLFMFWMNFLSYGRAFEGTGFMLRILIQVLKDVKYFAFILFTLICAFAYSGNKFHFF